MGIKTPVDFSTGVFRFIPDTFRYSHSPGSITFSSESIYIANILYLTRQNPHTKITFFDGKEILTEIPVKEIAIYLPDEEFVNITKGILLRKSQIVNISDPDVQLPQSP